MNTPPSQFQGWVRDAEWVPRADRHLDRHDVVNRACNAAEDQADTYLGTDAITGLDGLDEAVRAQRMVHNDLVRCRLRLGRELAALRAAGGSWAEISAHTWIEQGTVESLAAEPIDQQPMADTRIDSELAAAANEAGTNPILRARALATWWEHYSRTETYLQTVIDELCVELDRDGVARARIARHASMSTHTLGRRLRARMLALPSPPPGPRRRT